MNFTVEHIIPQSGKLSIVVDFQNIGICSELGEEVLQEETKRLFKLFATNLTMFFASTDFTKAVIDANEQLHNKLEELTRLSIMEMFLDNADSVPEELMHLIGLGK